MISAALQLRQLLQNLKLSPAGLEALRERKLRTMIRHAYEHVPYYRSRFRSAGLCPEDIREIADLKHVPITTKEDLRAAGAENATIEGIDCSSCVTLETSGTTGEPFRVSLTRGEARARRLLDFRALLVMGFRPRDRLAVLGPSWPHPVGWHQRLGLYWGENISLLLPIEDQIRRLQRIPPTVLWAYPTGLRALLHQFEYRLSRLVRPRALITSAEALDDVVRDRIRADREMEMFNFYGAMEVGRIASECKAHRGLHVSADRLILECLEGDRTTASGESTVVVVTSLDNFAMPFIRYRLGDLCRFSGENCPCGLAFPLIDPPRGREWDLVKLPSGKLLSPLGFVFILRRFPGINQFRLIQESSEHLVLQLVLQKTLPPPPLSQLRVRLLEHVKEPIRLDVQLVDFIREDSLKFRTFTSKLSQAELYGDV